jgi:hypothetical protein
MFDARITLPSVNAELSPYGMEGGGAMLAAAPELES